MSETEMTPYQCQWALYACRRPRGTDPCIANTYQLFLALNYSTISCQKFGRSYVMIFLWIVLFFVLKTVSFVRINCDYSTKLSGYLKFKYYCLMCTIFLFNLLTRIISWQILSCQKTQFQQPVHSIVSDTANYVYSV